jgi:flagellar motor switch/type III secretory pathway protein FliN
MAGAINPPRESAVLSPRALRPDFTPHQPPTSAAPAEQLAADPASSQPVDIRIQWGTGRVTSDELERISAGSMVQLAESASDPLSIYAGDRLLALGQTVVSGGRICVRVTRVIR